MATTIQPQSGPIEIPYKRWRHKDRGYLVTVLEVHHRLGEHGWLTTVRVLCTDWPRPKSWPAQVFLNTFESVVKRKVMTRYQRIAKKDRDST